MASEVVKGGTKFPHSIKNANGGILEKSALGIDRNQKIAYY